jgi:hypothetical protein
MIAVVFFATALSLFSAPAAEPTATAPAGKPTREIVYSFTFDETQENTTEVFGSAPESDSVHASYAGTLTFDVMQAAPNGDLLVSITEATNAINNKKPITGEVVVRHSGNLDFGGEIGDELSLLMPYLASGYFGDHLLQKGQTWQTDAEQDGVQLVSTFTVSNATEDAANIDVVMQTKRGYLIGTMTIDEKLAYRIKASVPSALDVMITRLTSGPSGVDAHSHYHFRLTSDSSQAPPAATGR